MNKITIIFGLSLSIFLSGISSAAAETLKIAALVNGEIISSEDLQNRINAFRLTTGIPYNNETRGMIRHRVHRYGFNLCLCPTGHKTPVRAASGV